MLHLMNSLMMPTTGLTYKPRTASRLDFKQAFQKSFGNWKSYIGYPTTAEYIAKIVDCPIPISRDETKCVGGDTLLVCKLKYRPDTANMKTDKAAQAALTDNDFELYIVEVSK